MRTLKGDSFPQVRSARRLMTGLILILSVLLIAPALSFGESGADPSLMSSLVLRHRVAVVALSAKSKNKKNITRLIRKLDSSVIFADDGVMISPSDWATAVDLTKSEISGSRSMSLVELPLVSGDEASLASARNELNLVLFVSYSSGESSKRVFFRLVQAATGRVIHTADESAADIDGAVAKAITEIDDFILRMPWRCKVEAIANGEMIINRGAIDGLDEGVELVGYSMKKQPEGSEAEPEELRLMKYGQRSGLYRVTEVRGNFSKVVASSGGAVLVEGDMLELPEIKIKKRGKRTRGSEVWNKLYEK